jgi:hypothetical protein
LKPKLIFIVWDATSFADPIQKNWLTIFSTVPVRISELRFLETFQISLQYMHKFGFSNLILKDIFRQIQLLAQIIWG